MSTVFIWGSTVSSASGLRGNTSGHVLLLNYLRALWRESCSQGTVSVCKRNKQAHTTKPGSVARTPLFIDEESASDIYSGFHGSILLTKYCTE